jgi:hypothetical protein
VIAMAGNSNPSPAAPLGPEQIMRLGKERTEELVALQQELFKAYEEASRVWLARVHSEMELWSNLAKKLTESRSAPEVLEAYQQCVTQRMQMAGEDGRRLSEEVQKIMSKVTDTSWAKGPPLAS